MLIKFLYESMIIYIQYIYKNNAELNRLSVVEERVTKLTHAWRWTTFKW